MSRKKVISGSQTDRRQVFYKPIYQVLTTLALAFEKKGWSKIEAVGNRLIAKLQSDPNSDEVIAVVTCLEVKPGHTDLMMTLFTSAKEAKLDLLIDAVLLEAKLFSNH